MTHPLILNAANAYARLTEGLATLTADPAWSQDMEAAVAKVEPLAWDAHYALRDAGLLGTPYVALIALFRQVRPELA